MRHKKDQCVLRACLLPCAVRLLWGWGWGGDINCRYITLNTPHVFICKLHITHIGNIETEHLDNKNIKLNNVNE